MNYKRLSAQSVEPLETTPKRTLGSFYRKGDSPESKQPLGSQFPSLSKAIMKTNLKSYRSFKR